MNTWQEGRPGGGGGTPYGEGNGPQGQGGGAAEPPLPASLNPRGPGAAAPQRPSQQAGYGQPQPPAGHGPASSYGPPAGYGAPSGPGQASSHGQGPAQGPGGVPPQRPGGSGGPIGPGGAQPSAARSRWPRRRKIKVTVLALVVALMVTTVGTWFWADSKLNHENVLADYPGRPAAGKGTNWLIVGSDSRDGLSDSQENDLHTGHAGGKRSDSMMILHVGDNGNTLMSIPRDSWVPVPEHPGDKGKTVKASTTKINAAFAAGGGKLLAQTVETNTGIRIDHYAEIGFAGFVGIVDSVGGVEMNIEQDVKDKDSGLDLKAGTQTLTGTQALAFVRQRHQMADQDLGRMRNQQKFLGALAKQAASPATLLNPFTFYPLVSSGLGTLIVDEDAGLTDLGSLFLAMKDVNGGGGKSITVPIANPDFRTPTGESAVKWDSAKAKQVFDAFKNDTAVPDTK
ncbi:LCP family protein [Kitasatospora sp. NBC_00240]|uniref:LCP family protein n=1 Tax=Kitasatospora sp. NBC_00240 TaxID=2903567 RepID=UPI00225032E1|nr:LCP family protein [Kitasatospora sp. NBC_00240]MCX5212593.1 LCP family protein [Kitasatospora sp. NBC_00240]